jgi:hypothetical protein
MTYFDGFGNYGNSTNQKLEVTNGNSATKKNGDSYSGQDGNSTTHSIGNLNSFRRGYSNTLVEGFNFSTTLGASFSTVVGANVPSTGGGKIEHINPFSLKWTQGLYDYDFKNCHTQVKTNEGKNIYTVNSPDLHEWKGLPYGKETKLVDKKQDFAKSADEWLGTKSAVIQSEIRKVLDGDMTYGTMTTTVTGTCKTTAGGGASKMQMDIGQINLKTINFAVDATVVSIKGTGNAKIEAATISIG